MSCRIKREHFKCFYCKKKFMKTPTNSEGFYFTSIAPTWRWVCSKCVDARKYLSFHPHKPGKPKLITIKITESAACEAIARQLMDSEFCGKGAIAELSYKIARALGITVKRVYG